MKYDLIFGVQEFKLNAWKFLSPTFTSAGKAEDYRLEQIDRGYMHQMRVRRIWRLK